MVANLVVWDGDPLEITSSAEQVFIQGKTMPMKSRQTQLRDRYLQKDDRRSHERRPAARQGSVYEENSGENMEKTLRKQFKKHEHS